MSDQKQIIESKLNNLNLETSWLNQVDNNNLMKIYRIIKYNFHDSNEIIDNFLMLIGAYVKKCNPKLYLQFNYDISSFLKQCNNILTTIATKFETITIKYNKVKKEQELLSKDKEDILKINMMLECTNTLSCIMFKIEDDKIKRLALSATYKYQRIESLLSSGFNIIYLIPTSKFTITTDPNIKRIVNKYGKFDRTSPSSYNITKNFDPKTLINEIIKYVYNTSNEVELKLEENKDYKLHLLSSNDKFVNLINFEYKNKECIVQKLNITPYDNIDLDTITIKLPNIMVKTLGVLN